MEQETVKHVIVVGASAGGIAAVSRLAASFNAELEAAVLVVIHLSHTSAPEIILNFIQQHTWWPCKLAEDGDALANRTIFLAPTDQQLTVEGSFIRLSDAAVESKWRPSIDVLFCSAALAYQFGATGIILSGLLGEGAIGMLAIKKSGGLCIVQDPEEAEYPDMPEDVIEHVEVDYTVSVDEIIYILLDRISGAPQ
jgi:two-component system chemotaxis response regulator CheB